MTTIGHKSLAEQIASSLEGFHAMPYGFICNCPCHEDKDASLTVVQCDVGNVIFECAAGCSLSEIENAIQEKGFPLIDEIIHADSKREDEIERINRLADEMAQSETHQLQNGEAYANGHAANHDEPSTIKGYESIAVGDWIAKEEIPATPLLAGVFDRGDKVVIIAKSKTRKSFFAQQLAFCLTSGRSFLGFDSQARAKVLLIQSEIKTDRYHSRCVNMARRMTIDGSELATLSVVNARGCFELQDLIKERIQEFSPDVVIIDPFYKLISGDENKAEDVKPILAFFDKLAEKSGAAIIYVHHDKKGAVGDMDLTDRGSGTGLLSRDFDSAILLSPHESESDQVVMEFVTRNYKAPEARTIEWMNYCFITSENLPKKKTKRSAAVSLAIKLPALVLCAKKLLRTEYHAGTTEIPMATFNAKLMDAGIAKHNIMPVKEELLRERAIEIESRKAARGESSKVVLIYNPTEKPQVAYRADGDDSLF